MKQCLVLGGSSYRNFLLIINKYTPEPILEVVDINPYNIKTSALEAIKNGDYALIVFTGGADVTPSYYGDHKKIFTVCEPKRDAIEKEIYDLAVASNTPMLGICRGSQFLTAMQPNGKLLQHVEGHTREHSITIDPEYTPDFFKSNRVHVTSTHHQMMDLSKINKDSYVLIGKVELGDDMREEQLRAHRDFGKMLNNKSSLVDIPFDNPEIVYFIDNKALAIQGHPEFNNSSSLQDSFGKLSMHLISSLLLKEDISFNKGSGLKFTSSYGNYIGLEPRVQGRVGVDPFNEAILNDLERPVAAPIETPQRSRACYFVKANGDPIVTFMTNDPPMIIDTPNSIAVVGLPDGAFIRYDLLKSILLDMREQLDYLTATEIFGAVWELYFSIAVTGRLNGNPVNAADINLEEIYFSPPHRYYTELQSARLALAERILDRDEDEGEWREEELDNEEGF